MNQNDMLQLFDMCQSTCDVSRFTSHLNFLFQSFTQQAKTPPSRCPELRNAERDHCESRKHEGKKIEIPSTVHIIGLCESSDHFRDFVIMNFIMLESRWLEGKNIEIPSVVRLRKEGIILWSLVDHWSGSISGIVTWSVETLLHRNAEMPKCKNTFWCRLWSSLVVMWEGGASTKLSSFLEIVTWRVETLHHRNAEMPKCEMAKSMRYPLLVIQ